jgi:hypothetical protein
MGNSFSVVTDVSEVAQLNKQLARRLRKTFRFQEAREITYPAGHQSATVYFESSSGTAVRAWSPRSEPDKLLNFVISGDPGSTKWIEITVQLNFPAGRYNRRLAGAFVRDANGEVFIAHRGKLTKGKAGLPKAQVFREFAPWTVEVEDAGKTSTVILISELDDPALADRLWDFAEEAREVATRLGQQLHGGGSSKETPGGTGVRGRPPTSSAERLLKLRAYFDEHAGEGAHKGHAGGQRTVEHGAVVKALEAALRSKGASQKAQAIDLAIVAAADVDLFEVKTSARTTDVYTGVGQLLIHGECIAELLGLPVKRHLVLPDKPKASHAKHIYRKADISVVTFQNDGGSYRFNGLL